MRGGSWVPRRIRRRGAVARGGVEARATAPPASAGSSPRTCPTVRVVDATELAFAGIARQAALIAAAEISARELVACVLERIERIDAQINAFRVVFAEQALAQAEQVVGDAAQPLAGVPIALK